MHGTMVWWSLWGLIVGIALFGLQETHRNSIHWMLSLPLLTGALAAAALRLKHEYHEAMVHAKWVGLSAGLFLLGMGSLYLKAQAYGPFATATSHRAFLGATFGMSIAEVERALGRKLSASQGGLRERVLSMIPDLEKAPETRSMDLVAYRVPSKARFEFVGGQLAKVALAFQPTTAGDTAALSRRIQEDLEKDYKRVETSGPEGSVLYRKEAVDASLVQTPVDPLHQQLTVHLQYMPLADQRPGPLTVEAKLF
jgi:hypothetical protein